MSTLRDALIAGHIFSTFDEARRGWATAARHDAINDSGHRETDYRVTVTQKQYTPGVLVLEDRNGIEKEYQVGKPQNVVVYFPRRDTVDELIAEMLAIAPYRAWRDLGRSTFTQEKQPA